jgi:hypothetical protein
MGTRRKQLHEKVHALTSDGTDPIGETEVQLCGRKSIFFVLPRHLFFSIDIAKLI